MRFLSTIAILLCVMATLSAQDLKLLSVIEDTEGGIGVYPCGDRHEAMVQFVTNETFGLDFKSNYDPDLKVEVDSVAGKKTYTLVFVTQAPGVSYDGRRLTIMVPGFRHHVMTLNLRDKQKFVYNVSDPYSQLRSPYFVYQEKANDQFYEGQYQRAKDTYQMIRVCPEYELNKVSVDERIAICDSMIEWSGEALRLYQFAQFIDAYNIYQKMYFHNSSNPDIAEKIGLCQRSYMEDCENEYLLAEHYMDNNQIELARASYQRIIDKKCSSHMTEATVALTNINKHEAKVSQHARCFFYELGPNQPIGLTYAQCYNTGRRSSGYITLRVNGSCLKSLTGRNAVDGKLTGSWPSDVTKNYTYTIGSSIQTNPSDLVWSYDQKYELDGQGDEHPKNLDFETGLTFGWTIRIWRYFFAHLGLGYHGGGFYTFDYGGAPAVIRDWKKRNEGFDPTLDFNSWNDKLRYDCMDTNWFHGAAGEFGLIVKAWRLNLKATYQYTYWLNDTKYKDFLDDNSGKIYMGVGFNW